MFIVIKNVIYAFCSHSLRNAHTETNVCPFVCVPYVPDALYKHIVWMQRAADSIQHVCSIETYTLQQQTFG